MKVLVTGRAIPHQPDRSTGQQLQQGFIQAGHDCVFYGNFYGEPYRWLGATEATTQEFDLVVVTEMNDSYPGYENLFSYLNLKNVPRLYQDYDVSYHPQISYSRAIAYCPDGFLVANRHYLGKDAFGRFDKPVLHLPYACSPQIHRRKPEIKREHIMGFVGSITVGREWLKDKVHCISGAFGEALIDETNKISIMVHINQDACKGLCPGRPWESLGCGTTLLMDRSSYEDFIEFLPSELHECIFVFDNAEDVQKWITEWSNKLSTLEKYGARVQRYMYQHHTYRNRAESIISFARASSLL